MVESGESIRNLIPDRYEVPEKPPMYVSKYPGSVDPHGFELGVAKVSSHSTFGLASGLTKPRPDSFLKSHAGEPLLAEPGPVSKPKEHIKPPVPKKMDKPVMGLQSSKNFITANAVETILSAPKKVSGDEKLYTQKPNYGKVPKYLNKVKATIAEEKTLIAEQLAASEAATMASQVRMRQMTEEEKAAILADLKTKWASINEMYQKMTFTLDTPAKRTRKERYEDQLAQLEKDIETLSKKVVMVEDTS